MELKTARLTLLIDPNKKAAFERLCALQDRSASQVVRQLIREYLARHGVEYTAAGSDDEAADAPGPARSAVTPARLQPEPTPAASAASAPAVAARRRRR